MAEREITIKIAYPQLEYLENRARELGLSKEELIKRYIAGAINEERSKLSKKQRLAQILSVEGKYSSVLTSGDGFAQQKQKENRMEK